MTPYEIVQIILGIAFLFFVPGWLFVRIFFDEIKKNEKIFLSVIISLMMGLAIAVFFGYDINQAAWTGGFIEKNIWLTEFGLTLILAIILIIKNAMRQKFIEFKDKRQVQKDMTKKKQVSKEKRKKTIKNKKPKTSLSDKFQTFKNKKGIYQLVMRTILFFVIILGVYFAIFLWIRHLPFFIQHLSIDTGFYFDFLTGLRKTDFLNAGVFALIAFVVWNRESLKKMVPYDRKSFQTIIFAVLAIIFIAGHYYLKYWIGANIELATSMTDFFTVFKLLLIVLFVAFTALAIYGLEFFYDFIKKYWKSILIFLTIGVVYFFLIQFFQLIWYQLSYFVSVAIKNMLELTFNPVLFSPGTLLQGPRLGVEGFIVGISNECSGVDSLLLFISLYVLLLALDWRKMNVKRMLILAIPGIIGTVAYNILRIYLLLLVGIYIDKEFAVDVFHTNIGWILFLLFFVVFWHFGSKWVYISQIKKREDERKKRREEDKDKYSKEKTREILDRDSLVDRVKAASSPLHKIKKHAKNVLKKLKFWKKK